MKTPNDEKHADGRSGLSVGLELDVRKTGIVKAAKMLKKHSDKMLKKMTRDRKIMLSS